MLIIECEQGSPEWFLERSGSITASNFAECRKRLTSGKHKGQHSAKAKEYAFRLAIERISGDRLEEDKFETFEMRRGRELEPEARSLHEQKIKMLIEHAGIVFTEDRIFGASADGLIGEEGCAEYKCFISPKSLMPILLDGDISSCEDQVQGQLWITGRKWSDFVLYCPALKSIGKDLTIIRVERDDNFIEAMEIELLEFNTLVEEYKTILSKEDKQKGPSNAFSKIDTLISLANIEEDLEGIIAVPIWSELAEGESEKLQKEIDEARLDIQQMTEN